MLSACGSTQIKGVGGSRRKRATLSLAALGRLEAELGVRLHDDVLVLLAIRDPIVALLTGIGALDDMAAAAETEAPEGLVCIAIVPADPVGERLRGEHGGASIYLCVPRATDGPEARLLVYWDGIDTEPPEDDAVGESIHRFVTGRIREARTGRWGELVSTAEGREEPLEPAPRLVPGRTLKLDDGAGEIVAHAKFGQGTVVRRIGEGDAQKVVVRFADAERTVLARFLQA